MAISAVDGDALGPDFETERSIIERGYVIGVDEAGRGPWAGPVCAAAFWIDPRQLTQLPQGLNDSKKITAKKRVIIESALYDGRNQGHLSLIHI